MNDNGHFLTDNGAEPSNVVHPLPCSYCYKRLDAAKACLLAIEPAEIAARAGFLLTAANSS